MDNQFLTGAELPFCKGCGHSLISEHTEKAFQKLGLKPLDVILVTDIGCHGIVDKNFLTHTFHGLHGRSVALGSGLSAGMNNSNKKVIVFVGDGGATIGMQHLIDAAHNNFNMTVVVHNNMLYGMTGGQPSELTPQGFKTPTLPGGASEAGYDICSVVTAAGANYVCRVMGMGDISDHLATAFSKSGFSLIEVMEICPSYGVKSNPGMKLSKVVEESGLEVKVFADKNRAPYQLPERKAEETLLERIQTVNATFTHKLKGAVRIMLAGSAGEGVQAAADFFATSGMKAGLNVTKKGSYPVTVGVGFSASEIIVSPEEILYTGSPSPEVLIITSVDGLNYAKATAGKLSMDSLLVIDESLELPETKAEVIRWPFRERAGGRTASLYALFYYLNYKKIFPIQAIEEVITESKLAGKIKMEKMLDFE